jgi:hypothetical protein
MLKRRASHENNGFENEFNIATNNTETTTKGKSIKSVFVASVFLFLIFFIFVIFYSNFLIIKSLYDEINQNYLRQYVIEPLSNLNENFTKSAEIRLRIQEQIILESKMQNLKIMANFALSNNFKFNSTNNFLGYEYYYYNQTNDSYKSDKLFFDNFRNYLYYSRFNFFEDFKPEEVIAYNPSSGNSLYLYNDYDRNRPYLRKYLSDNYDTIYNDVGKNKFKTADYIVVNPISIQDYYNYVKVISFTTDVSESSALKSLTIAMRFNIQDTQTILNRDSKNITFLFQTAESDSYFPTSSTMADFFNFGLDVLQLNRTYLVDLMESLSSHRREIVRMSLLYNLDNFFTLLNLRDDDLNPIGFNPQLDNEFFVLGSLFYTIEKMYFGKDVFQLPPYNLGNKLTACNSFATAQRNSKISPINCEIATFDQESLLTISIYKANMTTVSDMSSNIFNLISQKFGESKYYSISVFQNQDKSIMGAYNLKKILVYISQINNLKFIAIEILNLESFSNVESFFIQTTTKNSNILIIILGIFCLIVFLFSIMISLSSINQLISRIHALNEIKNQIFFKDKCLGNIDVPISQEVIDKCISKVIKGELTLRERYDLSKNDKFYEQLIIIIIETKLKLTNFLKNADSGKILF